jgi:hypothetical protein
LRSEKIFAIRAEGEMKHSNFAVPGRFRLLIRGEQSDPGVSFANKSRDAIPHAIMKVLEPENIDVPFGRALDVAHAHGYMINTFELHEMFGRIYRIPETIKVERVVLNASATARAGSVVNPSRRCMRGEPRTRRSFCIAFGEVDPPRTYFSCV